MKYLITKAVIYYDKSSDNNSSIIPNVVVESTEIYKEELKKLVNCDKVYLSFEEVELSHNHNITITQK